MDRSSSSTTLTRTSVWLPSDDVSQVREEDTARVWGLAVEAPPGSLTNVQNMIFSLKKS